MGVESLLCLMYTVFGRLSFPIIAIIPLIAIKPADEVETMLAAVIVQIAVDQLCLHGPIELCIPATFYFNDSG